MTAPIDLPCQDVVELVTDYLSHALSPEDRAGVEKHLLTCPPCTAYLAQVRTTIRLTGELAVDAPAVEDAGRELLSIFRRWRGT
jgi:anti-sigma factor RsiW